MKFSNSLTNSRNGEITFMDMWRLFRRRRTFIYLSAIGALLAGVIFCIVSQKRYQAVGELQVERESLDGLGLSSLMGSASGASDALDANITMQTEATILRSDTLALRVIEDLKLESTPDFRPRFNPVSWAMGLISPQGPADPANAALEASPARRSHALLVFSKNLSVKPVPGTRLIQVSYMSPDPKVAAEVANRLIQTLTDFSFQTRYNATSQAANWLGSQLSDLRKQSEDLQTKVVELQRDSGVFALAGGNEADGKSAAGAGLYSTVLDQLQQATTTLTQAQANRIMRRAIYEAAKSGDSDLISGLAGSASASGLSSGMASSLSLVQSLRLQRATLQGQYEEAAAKFGPAYPKLEEMHANLASIDAAIHQELQRLSERARSDFEISESVEHGVRELYETRKHDADKLNDKAIEYSIAKQEAEQSRTLYETLLGHLREAGALAGLRSSNISIVDPARVPSKPAKPNVPLMSAASLICGLLCGIAGAIIIDLRDNKIRDLNELEMQAGRTTIGVLPLFMEKERLTAGKGRSASKLIEPRPRIVALDEPRSPYAEAMRALRTSILLSRSGAPPQVVLVTSSMPAEGKTTLSINLAVLLSQHGKNVLLVDGDLRRPMLHRILDRDPSKGLSSILAGELQLDDESAFTNLPEAPGLQLICAGSVPPYPSELLGSDRMKRCIDHWRERYDFVIVDGAPVLPVTDSVILSKLADSTLLVARFGSTERQALERSYALLERSCGRERDISIVINAVDSSTHSYQDYYGYSPCTYSRAREKVSA